MKSRILLLSRIALVSVAVTAGAVLASAAPALTPIFNGKDFTGWKVPENNHNWSVQDGLIIGVSEPTLHGSYLWTEKTYGDFIFETEVKFEGDEIDSGVDIRKPNFQLQWGVSRSLHRDMTGSWLTDGKGDPTRYPESGRANDWEKYFKKGDWNTFRIEAKGNTFTAWLNGHQISQYTNARYAEAGPIGLQFHDGLKMKLYFRNLSLVEL